MRIHTDHLTFRDFFDALDAVRQHTGSAVYFHGAESLPRYGSRSHRAAYGVTLASDGKITRRRVNYGTARDRDRFDRPFSATYDQWGWFLAHLFTVDAGAQVGSAGSPVYRDAADFHERTGMRYTDFDGYRYTVRDTVRGGTLPALLTV